MGYSKQVYDRAWEALAKRKSQAQERAAARKAEVHKAIPTIQLLEREMAQTAASVTRTILASPHSASDQIEKLAKKNLDLQKKRIELLVAAGYPEDYLTEQYACSKCRDSGYQGIRMCSCMEDLLKREAYAQLSQVSAAEHSHFSNFSLSYYPDEPVDRTGIVPRVRMGEVLDVCRHYAQNFTPQSESLLMLGRTGLGKTHLSLAIASTITKAGHGVVYTSVQKLMDRLEADKFSRDSDAKENYLENTSAVLECDLLVLDDLGTEFITQFTNSVLYNIINSRLVEGRPTIISTNLELPDIEERYSQRMVSRLVCGYKVLKFYGKDIRYIKKMRGGLATT